MNNIFGKYERKQKNEEGKTEIVFSLYSYSDDEKIKELEKGEIYKMNMVKATGKRTLEQNAYLWSLLRDISISLGGNRDTDVFSVYLQALKRANAKSTIVSILEGADDLLLKQFRASLLLYKVKDEEGRVFNTYQVFYGSSKMDKSEMAILLDTVLDMASECGVEVYEQVDY